MLLCGGEYGGAESMSVDKEIVGDQINKMDIQSRRDPAFVGKSHLRLAGVLVK